MNNETKLSSSKNLSSPMPVILGVVITAIALFTFALVSKSSGEFSEDSRNKREMANRINRDWFFSPQIPFSVEEIVKDRFAFRPVQYVSDAEKSAGDSYAKEIVEAYQEANLMHFSEVSRHDIERVSQLLAIRSDDWFETVKDLGSFVHLGEPIYEACQKGLTDLLKAAKNGEITLEEGELTGELLTAPSTETYRKNCGDALPILLEHGLVANNEWTSNYAPFIFGAMQRRRFIEITLTRLNLKDALSPADRFLLDWWRTMMPTAFDTESRLTFLDVSIDWQSPLNEVDSPFYFDKTRAKGVIELQSTQDISEGEKKLRLVYKNACKNSDATKIDLEVCRWLDFHKF